MLAGAPPSARTRARSSWFPGRGWTHYPVECPRHGSLFDLKTGNPKTLPAYVPVDTFPVIIEDETIKLEVE